MKNRNFIPKIQTTSCPPQRRTTPRSFWRDIMCGMKPGNWFEFPARKVNGIRLAATRYTRGRHSVYQHPTKADTYVYVRIK